MLSPGGGPEASFERPERLLSDLAEVAETIVDPKSLTVRQLKAFLTKHAADFTALREKSELLTKAEEVVHARA